MTASEVLMAHAKLTERVTAATLEAIKGGLTRDEVAAVLARIQEIIENGDDE
jgi:hypothetical protein